jgi:hypothetical protein
MTVRPGAALIALLLLATTAACGGATPGHGSTARPTTDVSTLPITAVLTAAKKSLEIYETVDYNDLEGWTKAALAVTTFPLQGHIRTGAAVDRLQPGDRATRIRLTVLEQGLISLKPTEAIVVAYADYVRTGRDPLERKYAYEVEVDLVGGEWKLAVVGTSEGASLAQRPYATKDEEDALAGAAVDVVRLFTMRGGVGFDKSFAAAMSAVTGEARTTFASQKATLRQRLATAKIRFVSPEVEAIGLETPGSPDITLLSDFVLRSSVQGGNPSALVNEGAIVRLTMVKVAGKWLISKYTPLPTS